METKNFLGLEGLNHFWEKAKIWIINEITTKIAGIVLSSVPTGTILHGMWKSAPKEFLLCNGATYPTSQYPKLASVLGATGSTFQVPDLRNRTVMGANPNVAGRAGGNTSNVGDIQKASVPNITGNCGWVASDGTAYGYGALTLDSHTKNGGWDRNGGNYSRQIVFNAGANYSGVLASSDHLGDNVFANGAQELRSANIRMNYIIKY